MIILATLALLSSGSDAPSSDVHPARMSGAKIRAWNAGRNSQDPNFIRCERRAETGSWAKRTLSCRTNMQWSKAGEAGNQQARDLMESSKSKAWNSSGP